MRIPFALASALGLALASSPARADEMPGPPGAPPPAAPPVSGKFFDAHDANRDGKVTREEFLAQKGDEEVFDLLDKDGDRVVTLEEVGLPADYVPKPLPPAPPGGAEPGAGMRDEMRKRRAELMAMDLDKDGRVSREEYKGSRKFESLDRNKDGYLSAEDSGGGDRTGMGVERRFKERDKNGDGRLTADEFPEAERFKALDKDADGAVTLAEMRAAPRDAKAPGRGDAPPGAGLARADKDGDGKVTRAEFPGSDDAFRALDANGDGAITLDEVRKAQPTPPPGGAPPAGPGTRKAPVSPLFSALDKDRDGRLARNEFPGDDAGWRALDRDSDGWITPEEAR